MKHVKKRKVKYNKEGCPTLHASKERNTLGDELSHAFECIEVQ